MSQVVIPEDEMPAAAAEEARPLPDDAPGAGFGAEGGAADGEGGEGGGEGGGGAGGEGGFMAFLAPLEEEYEALAERVGEMEKMVARGVAAQLRAIIQGRLKSLDERLTQVCDARCRSRVHDAGV